MIHHRFPHLNFHDIRCFLKTEMQWCSVSFLQICGEYLMFEALKIIKNYCDVLVKLQFQVFYEKSSLLFQFHW